MSNIHRSFLMPFFKEMNIVFKDKWCVLHSYEHLPDYSESDVDMTIHGGTLNHLEFIINKIADENSWEVLQKFWYDIQRCVYFVLKKKDDNIYLAIDLLIDNKGLGRYGFPTSMLIQNCSLFKGEIPVPNPAVAFCYKLVKRKVKGRLLENDREFLLYQYSIAEKKGIDTILHYQFGRKGVELINYALIHKDLRLTEGERNYLVKCKKRILFKGLKLPEIVYWQIKRILNRIFNPRGIVIYIPKYSTSEINYLTNSLKLKVGLLFRDVIINNNRSLFTNL